MPPKKGGGKKEKAPKVRADPSPVLLTLSAFSPHLLPRQQLQEDEAPPEAESQEYSGWDKDALRVRLSVALYLERTLLLTSKRHLPTPRRRS